MVQLLQPSRAISYFVRRGRDQMDKAFGIGGVMAGLVALSTLDLPAPVHRVGVRATEAAVPIGEPGTLILLGAGLIGLSLIGYLRQRRKTQRSLPRPKA